MEDMIIKLLSQGLVPTALALYVLIEVNKSIKGLGKAFDRNTRVLVAVLGKMGFHDELKTLFSDIEEESKKAGE